MSGRQHEEPARITAFPDPWVKHPANGGDVPRRALLVARYRVDVGLDSFEESAFLDRVPDRDELWVRSDLITGRAHCRERCGNALEASLGLLRGLFLARLGFGWPQSLLRPGVVDAAAFASLVASIEAEVSEKMQTASTQSARIIDLARELSLGPRCTTGTWQATCPGTNHALFIEPGLEQFFCGYCKRKGGPADLRRFVAARRPARGERGL